MPLLSKRLQSARDRKALKRRRNDPLVDEDPDDPTYQPGDSSSSNSDSDFRTPTLRETRLLEIACEAGRCVKQALGMVLDLISDSEDESDTNPLFDEPAAADTPSQKPAFFCEGYRVRPASASTLC